MSLLRFLTAGESHGPKLTAILEGMVAGVPVSDEVLDRDMARRQAGYGSGGRMRIEHDHATQADVDLLLNVAKQMQNKCLCPLGEFSTMAPVTAIERFPDDFRRAVERDLTPAERDV